MDVFSWSMPFLAEKVTAMLLTIVKKGGIDGIDEDAEEKPNQIPSNSAKVNRGLVMKNKVKSVAKMSRMFTMLREESETLLKLKNMSPDGKLPRGILLEGKPAIKNALK
jgi:serine/threonine-protein phosphatase 2B catalytic subunit